MAAQLLGQAFSAPTGISPAPDLVRSALASRPSDGRVVSLRADDTDSRRTFRVELPADWWARKGRSAASEAFLVFLDGHPVPVVGADSLPSGSGFAERRARADDALWIHCRAGDACREAWVVRRTHWAPLVLAIPQSWRRPSALVPFLFAGTVAAAATWALSPLWPALPAYLPFVVLVALTATWLDLLRDHPAAIWGLLGVEALLAVLPAAANAARSALVARRTDVIGVAALVSLIATSWVGALFAVYRPGVLTPDSLDMYLAGVSGNYRHNVYPVAVSFLYGLAGRAFGSPAAILLAQLLGLAAGMALLASPWMPPKRIRRLLVFLAFLGMPPVWSIGVVLWSDVALTVAALWCAVALTRGRFFVGLSASLAASVLRHNAILATAPLLAFAIHGLIPSSRRALRIGVWCLAVAIGLAAPTAADRLAGVDDVWPVSPALVWDILSISRRHPQVWDASVLRFELQAEQVSLLFNPAHANPLFNPNVGPPGKRLDLYRLRSLKTAITHEWWAAVRAHPWTYLAGRTVLFLALLDVPGSPPCSRFHTAVLARMSPMFRGWLWCLTLIGEAVAGWVRARAQSPRFWIALSGLCYLFGFLPVGQGCDYRFLYWPMVACFAAAAAPSLVVASPRPEGAP